ERERHRNRNGERSDGDGGRRRRAATSSSSSDSDSDRRLDRHARNGASGAGAGGAGVDGGSAVAVAAAEEAPPTLEEVNMARVPRVSLERWVHEPYLAAAIESCLVKIAIGQAEGRQVYRVCEVLRVETGRKQYRMGDGPKAVMTDKLLAVRHGSLEKSFHMNMVSNHTVTELEMERWVAACHEARQTVPSGAELRRRNARMRAFVNGHSYTGQQVAEMVQRRAAAARGFENVTTTRLRLEAEIQRARHAGRPDDEARFEAQLKRVNEEHARRAEDKRRRALAAQVASASDPMREQAAAARRKREEAMLAARERDARKAAQRTALAAAAGVQATDSVAGNPFRRRACKPKTLWATGTGASTSPEKTMRKSPANDVAGGGGGDVSSVIGGASSNGNGHGAGDAMDVDERAPTANGNGASGSTTAVAAPASL
ncbi:unnamed protein product, partial [Phaeothamnion confervicola]